MQRSHLVHGIAASGLGFMLTLAAPVSLAQTTQGAGARFYSERQEVTPTYVDDVLLEFRLLKGYQHERDDRRNWLHAWTPGTFQFTFSAWHIQGVARLPQSNCVVLSGNPSDEARVAIVQLGTLAERGRGVLGNNAHPPDATDEVVKVMTLDSSHTHAGGLSTSGNIVAVPIEGPRPPPMDASKQSEIRFLFVPSDDCAAAYDLYDYYPEARIVRPNYGAGAVAITRLPVGPLKDHYLVGVNTGGDKRIWFYLSNTTEVVDGFQEVSFLYSDWFQHGGYWLQSINFITQPDGRVYLLGTGNSHLMSDGDDNSFLAHVDFPGNDPRFEPEINGQNQIHFMCDDKYGNFNAAAGAYVGRGGKLALYATPHSTYSKFGSGGGNIIHMHEFPWRPVRPVADAGPGQTVSAGSDCTAVVTLDGSASYDPDGNDLTYTWTWNDATATGTNPTVTLPVGTTTITLVVNDGTAESVPDYVEVTVEDETPPGLVLSADPNTLWPPNHKMVPVTVTAIGADNCDPSPVSVITSVSGTEDIAGVGVGTSAVDWMITGALTLELRAERSGAASGRVYTIEVACTDDSDNRSVGTVTVAVPHRVPERELR